MNWQPVWDGKMWVAEQSTQPDGRVFERVVRAPGGRILIVRDGKLLLNREKRFELDGKTDYRLPGGKVFDTNDEYRTFLTSGKEIADASRVSVAKEALEEVGIIVDPAKLEYLGVDVLGTTAAWDLHYWLATEFTEHADGAQFHESEADEIEGSSWILLEDVANLVLDANKFSESRSVAMIMRYLNLVSDENSQVYGLPFVGALIERTTADGTKELLIQTRMHAFIHSIYNGTFEFAAGRLDVPYENVYDAVAREIKEETGMTLKRIIDDSQTDPVSPQKSDKAFGFRPFCCTQQVKDGKPWVGFIFRCGVEDGEPVNQASESRDVHWVKAKDFYEIYKNSPEKIFTLELPAWEYYFKEQGYA